MTTSARSRQRALWRAPPICGSRGRTIPRGYSLYLWGGAAFGGLAAWRAAAETMAGGPQDSRRSQLLAAGTGTSFGDADRWRPRRIPAARDVADRDAPRRYQFGVLDRGPLDFLRGQLGLVGLRSGARTCRRSRQTWADATPKPIRRRTQNSFSPRAGGYSLMSPQLFSSLQSCPGSATWAE